VSDEQTRAAQPASNEETAAIALQFLSRADLKGLEVPAYAHVTGWLNAIATGGLVVQPPIAQSEVEGEPALA
jgi:hypothetical protein